MVKIYRTIPFDYYLVKFTNSSNNNLTSKVAHFASELFKNIIYIVANAAIKFANTLSLYRFTKIEIQLPQRDPFYTFSQALSASSFLFSNAAKLILGPGNFSYYSMSLLTVLQTGEGFGNIKNEAIRSVISMSRLFLSNRPFFRLSFALWASYSVSYNAYKGLKTCYNQAYRDPIKAVKGLAIHVVNVIAVVSVFNDSFKTKTA